MKKMKNIVFNVLLLNAIFSVGVSSLKGNNENELNRHSTGTQRLLEQQEGYKQLSRKIIKDEIDELGVLLQIFITEHKAQQSDEDTRKTLTIAHSQINQTSNTRAHAKISMFIKNSEFMRAQVAIHRLKRTLQVELTALV